MSTGRDKDNDPERDEIKQRYWQKVRIRKARTKEGERSNFRYTRFAAFPIALFALVLLCDKYFPRKVVYEVAQRGYQERGIGKRNFLYSFMETRSFTFAVPHDAHLDYPYSDVNKPKIAFELTPIFDIPVHASFTTGGYIYSFDLKDNIHNFFVPLEWLMLVCSLYTIFATKYNMRNYGMSFLPLLWLLLTVLRVLKLWG